VVRLDEDPEVNVPSEMLEKAMMAPLKNAIENTPDGGTVTMSLESSGQKAVLTIMDTGIGITEESRKQIFSGFYHARQTDLYSTKRPFDFGAGGKGLDLLRVRILSEAYGFGVECVSTRCRHIPEESRLCTGNAAKQDPLSSDSPLKSFHERR
jgi:signal transduction histidine kinase